MSHAPSLAAPLSAVIVDDESQCRRSLQHLLKTYCPHVGVRDVCTSVESALQTLRAFTPDILFLDVVLGDGTGFDILLNLDSDSTASVIFTTAHDRYALKALKFSALDYLLKPVDPDELVTAIGKYRPGVAARESRAMQLRLLRQTLDESAEPRSIALPTMDGFCFVELASIVACEAQSNYTKFKLLKGERLLVCRTLKEFEELLDEQRFVRIHRSHIINLNHLKKYVRGKGGYVIMSDGSELEVSARCKETLLARVNL